MLLTQLFLAALRVRCGGLDDARWRSLLDERDRLGSFAAVASSR